MILKNSPKSFVAMGLLYGAVMGAVFYLQNHNLTLGLAMGIFVGVLFGGIMFAVNGRAEKRGLALAEQIEPLRGLICHGAASYRKSAINAVGGWLMLTTVALEFYPHKMNVGGNSIPIMIRDIHQVQVSGNILTVKTISQEHRYQVVQAGVWKELIDLAVKTVQGR